MRVPIIFSILIILAASHHAKSQKQHEFKKLVGSQGYLLRVEVLQKPDDTVKWLGAFRTLWVKALKDYKHNFRNKADSIPVLIGLAYTRDISSWSHLEQGNQIIVFVTGTSLGYSHGSYYATVSDNAIGYYIGSRDRDGFRIGDSVVTYDDFKNVVDSVNHRSGTEKRHRSTLERHSLPGSSTWGIRMLWVGKSGGVYVMHSMVKDKYNRYIYLIDKRARLRVLAKGTDNDVVGKVRHFLIKQDCSAEELQKCLAEVRYHLENRTRSWSSS